MIVNTFLYFSGQNKNRPLIDGFAIFDKSSSVTQSLVGDHSLNVWLIRMIHSQPYLYNSTRLLFCQYLFVMW